MGMRMSHEGFLILLEECDDKSVLLSNLNPKHELLKFTYATCPLCKIHEVDLALVRYFLPGEEARTEKPPLEMVVAALGAYHLHLKAAICIEVTKAVPEKTNQQE